MKNQGRLERRFTPRFKLNSEVKIRSHKHGLLYGKAGDISETGVSAMMVIEVEVGETVELEFRLPVGGVVGARAIVRTKTAFRYGFEFVRPNPVLDNIKASCTRLVPCAQPKSGTR